MDIYVHINVDRKGVFMIEESFLYEIVGGKITFSATLVNTFSRGITTMLDLGRTLGTSIKMLVSGRRC